MPLTKEVWVNLPYAVDLVSKSLNMIEHRIDPTDANYRLYTQSHLHGIRWYIPGGLGFATSRVHKLLVARPEAESASQGRLYDLFYNMYPALFGMYHPCVLHLLRARAQACASSDVLEVAPLRRRSPVSRPVPYSYPMPSSNGAPIVAWHLGVGRNTLVANKPEQDKVAWVFLFRWFVYVAPRVFRNNVQDGAAAAELKALVVHKVIHPSVLTWIYTTCTEGMLAHDKATYTIDEHEALDLYKEGSKVLPLGMVSPDLRPLCYRHNNCVDDANAYDAIRQANANLRCYFSPAQTRVSREVPRRRAASTPQAPTASAPTSDTPPASPRGPAPEPVARAPQKPVPIPRGRPVCATEEQWQQLWFELCRLRTCSAWAAHYGLTKNESVYGRILKPLLAKFLQTTGPNVSQCIQLRCMSLYKEICRRTAPDNDHMNNLYNAAEAALGLDGKAMWKETANVCSSDEAPVRTAIMVLIGLHAGYYSKPGSLPRPRDGAVLTEDESIGDPSSSSVSNHIDAIVNSMSATNMGDGTVFRVK